MHVGLGFVRKALERRYKIYILKGTYVHIISHIQKDWEKKFERMAETLQNL